MRSSLTDQYLAAMMHKLYVTFTLNILSLFVISRYSRTEVTSISVTDLAVWNTI